MYNFSHLLFSAHQLHIPPYKYLLRRVCDVMLIQLISNSHPHHLSCRGFSCFLSVIHVSGADTKRSAVHGGHRARTGCTKLQTSCRTCRLKVSLMTEVIALGLNAVMNRLWVMTRAVNSRRSLVRIRHQAMCLHSLSSMPTLILWVWLNMSLVAAITRSSTAVRVHLVRVHLIARR